MRKSFKKALSLVLSAAMTLSLGAGIDFSTASATDGADTGVSTSTTSGGDVETTSGAGAYTAGVAFEMADDYNFRHGYNDDVMNAEGTKTAEQMYLEDYYAAVLGKEIPDCNGYAVYRTSPGLNTKKTELKKPENVVVYEGAVYSDTELTKDGEYTVSLSNLDLATPYLNSAGEELSTSAFNMLSVSTNIPKSETADVKVVASSVKIDDVEVASDVVLPLKSDNTGKYYQFYVANCYDTGVADGTKFNNDNKLTTIPSKSIEITFKIEGVDWGYVAPEATETPELATVAPEATLSPKATLDKPFDIYISANVNEALSPADGVGADGKQIEAATYASKEVKAKIDQATDKSGVALFDATKQNYYETDTASMTISETGEYQLSVVAKGKTDDFASSGAVWLPLLVDNQMPTTYNLVGKSIIVGEGETAKTYSWPAQLMQDSAGSVRLSVCNQWASDAEKAQANPLTDTIAIAQGEKVTFDFYVTGGAPVAAATATPAAVSTAASTSYDAYLGFQTNTYVFRNVFNDSTYGLNSKELDYKTEVGYWDNSKLAKKAVTFTDATMTDNTKYTVSVSGLDLTTLKGSKASDTASTAFNMLFISTSIPLSMKGVEVKDATLKIDGNLVKEYTVVPCKGDASGYYQFMLADAYAPADGTKDAAYPSGEELKVLPTSSIEVSYTVSGVDFDRHVVGPKKGKTFTAGEYMYKVTKPSYQSGDQKASVGTVQVVGLSKAGKKKASLSLGATAKAKTTNASGAAVTSTYKITTIKSKAFQKSSKLKSFSFKKATNIKKLPSRVFLNCKNLKSVVLGKKMKKIPAGAFQGCKSLSKITAGAKLSSVSKSAFKGCKKKITVAGTSKAANKKKIKKVYKKVK